MLLIDENLSIQQQNKAPLKKKGEKKVQDGRTQVLANKEITKGGKLLGYMNKSSIQTL
jgi:hypothetical protein